jgi:hypothetical protein
LVIFSGDLRGIESKSLASASELISHLSRAPRSLLGWHISFLLLLEL